MMKKAITTVLFANFLNAQETIQLDRPDQTESVYNTSLKSIIIS